MEEKELTVTELAKMVSYETGVATVSVLKVLECLTTLTAKEVVNGGHPDSDSKIDFCLWEMSRSKVDRMRSAHGNKTA